MLQVYVGREPYWLVEKLQTCPRYCGLFTCTYISLVPRLPFTFLSLAMWKAVFSSLVVRNTLCFSYCITAWEWAYMNLPETGALSSCSSYAHQSRSAACLLWWVWGIDATCFTLCLNLLQLLKEAKAEAEMSIKMKEVLNYYIRIYSSFPLVWNRVGCFIGSGREQCLYQFVLHAMMIQYLPALFLQTTSCIICDSFHICVQLTLCGRSEASDGPLFDCQALGCSVCVIISS